MMTEEQLADLANHICPMHVIIGPEGEIVRHGPTLHKIRGDAVWEGQPFFSVFNLQRPRRVRSFDDLMNTAGIKLHFELKGEPHTRMKGVLAPLPDGKGAFINLSFGISVLDAVRDFDLTSQDFSPTDLTIEMLYLVEAKSAAMEASRQLNQRLQGAKIAAEEQAFTDTLTGLKNRRAMDHVLNRLVNAGREFAVMHVDLDYFKQVNDTFGHAAGDMVLQRVAAVMVECTRDQDTIARVGGDEFVLIFEGDMERSRIDDLARRLIRQLEKPMMHGADECRISASAGTALSVDMREPDAATLLHHADVALYAAKRGGRAQHKFYDPQLESELDEEPCVVAHDRRA